MTGMLDRIKKYIKIWRKGKNVMGGGIVKFLFAYCMHRKMYLKFWGKRRFQIRIYGRPFYLRAFSRDLDFAYSILIGEERDQKMTGEYDAVLGDDVDGCLDLGANIGLFTVLYTLKNPDVKIIAIEPEGRNYELLRMNTEHLENVTVYQAGIWYRDAFVKVCPSRVMIETSHTGSEGGFFVEECSKNDQGAIKGICIDTILKKTSMEHFMVKMDIEGTEKEIFEHNALQWLDDCQVLVMETHERFFSGSGLDARIHKEMISRGYMEKTSGENKIYRKRILGS